MSVRLQPYPEYKDSGLHWVGRMPKHWTQRRMKYLFQERVKKGFPNEPLLAATQTKGVVRKEDYEERTVMAMKDLHLLKLVETGDFVISLRSFQGGFEISHCRGIISPAYTILTPSSKARRAYFKHFFKSPEFIQSMTLFVTGIREGQNIDYERLSRSHMPLPSDDEQCGIGRYLDWMNIRFSQANRSKQKLIALLTEQKQAIIQRAVTRGLNPGVKLKSSKNPWLGNIPDKWRQRPLWTISKLRMERNPGGLQLLSVFLDRGVIRYEDGGGQVHAPSLDLSNYQVVHKGDFVLNNQQAWRGSVGVSGFHGIISPAYIVLNLAADLDSTYANYLMRCRAMVDQFVAASKGVGDIQRQMFWPFMRIVQVPVPELDEQRQIVKHLDEATVGINQAISKAERQVALMREYRTRLVADVVTGKVDVREAAARLPEVEMLEDNSAPCVESGEDNSDLGE